jgi:hypothetical protein
MAVPTRTGMVAISWVLWLILVGMFVSAEVPQTPPAAIQPPADQGRTNRKKSPTVIAGNDLGFRVESTRNGVPVGQFVIRINGQWVDAQLGTDGVVPTGAK